MNGTVAEKRAWAGGLFEGEGSITTCGAQPRLCLKMTDRDVVLRFSHVVELGRVYGPYGPYGQRQAFTFWVATEDEGRAVYDLLMPWLGPRRRAQFVEHYGATIKHVKTEVLV